MPGRPTRAQHAVPGRPARVQRAVSGRSPWVLRRPVPARRRIRRRDRLVAGPEQEARLAPARYSRVRRRSVGTVGVSLVRVAFPAVQSPGPFPRLHGLVIGHRGASCSSKGPRSSSPALLPSRELGSSHPDGERTVTPRPTTSVSLSGISASPSGSGDSRDYSALPRRTVTGTVAFPATDGLSRSRRITPEQRNHWNMQVHLHGPPDRVIMQASAARLARGVEQPREAHEA